MLINKIWNQIDCEKEYAPFMYGEAVNKIDILEYLNKNNLSLTELNIQFIERYGHGIVGNYELHGINKDNGIAFWSEKYRHELALELNNPTIIGYDATSGYPIGFEESDSRIFIYDLEYEVKEFIFDSFEKMLEAILD